MSAPNRRQLLTGAVACAAGAAIVASGPALTEEAQGATINPTLTRLVAECHAADRRADAHLATLDALNGDVLSLEVERNNELNALWCDAMDEVAHHPVNTAADLNTKLAFMREHHMGDGRDWLDTISQDVARIVEARA